MNVKETTRGALHVACLLAMLGMMAAPCNPDTSIASTGQDGSDGGFMDGTMISSSAQPIYVNGNEGFAAVPGISGNGTPSTPYIIENRIIDAGGAGSGIYISFTDVHVIIRNCLVAGRWGEWGIGIRLETALNVNITGNTVVHNTFGIYISHSSNSSMVSGNNASYNQHGIYISNSHYNIISDNDASFNLVSGLSLSSSSNNVVSGNNASDNLHEIHATHGINVHRSSQHNTVTGNIASRNHYGIHIDASSNNEVSANEAWHNRGSGIHLGSSSNNEVSGNNVSGNEQSGIYLFSSHNNEITGNHVFDTPWGLYLFDSHNNQVIDNELLGTSVSGIYLSTSSSYNMVLDNVIRIGAGDCILDRGVNNDVVDNECIFPFVIHGYGVLSLVVTASMMVAMLAAGVHVSRNNE